MVRLGWNAQGQTPLPFAPWKLPEITDSTISAMKAVVCY